jgi:transketolase
MNSALFASLTAARRECALKILEMYKKANAGHIGSSLSCLEILVDLCFHRAKPEDFTLLSKGHAAAALYATLKMSGKLENADLDSFYGEGTSLAAHPPCNRNFDSIPFGTGSLGHGLSLGAGLALSNRYTAKTFDVRVVLSDGDCNEGSTWEAAAFAAHHRLSNLFAIVDLNSIQGFGRCRDILDNERIAEKWRSFGFAVAEADDGNSFESLEIAFNNVEGEPGPRCVIAKTIKGHGVSFMEDKVAWHYLPMSDEQYAQAVRETRELA